MHILPKFNTYLKIYSTTKAASTVKSKTQSDDAELCSSTELLIPPQDGFIDYVDKIAMDNILSPNFLHPGIEVALKRYGLEKRGEFLLLEELRNEVFQTFMSLILHNYFTIGRINVNFPKMYRKFYSIYGFSRNDLTIRSRHYENNGILKVGVLCAVAEEHEDCDLIDKLSTGVIEFKNDYFALQQTVNEMVKSGGGFNCLRVDERIDSWSRLIFCTHMALVNHFTGHMLMTSAGSP